MINTNKLSLVVVVCVAAFTHCSSSSAQQSGVGKNSIRYNVDLTDSKNHYLTIEATIPVEDDTTELMMAVWTPGSYLVREYARHVDSIDVTSKGQPLKFEKTRKNRWLVQTDGVKSFKMKYRVYCNEMSVRTNWVGNEYAMINGAPTFVTVPGRLDRRHVVQLTMPRKWTRSATSLRSTGDTPHTFVAENFDELVDSPIVAGNVRVYPFTVGGVEHQLVNIGESGYWDGTKAATDLKKIVQAHHDMWGVVPYDRYLFLNMIAETGGGLEHDNSTLIMTSRWTFRDKNRYKGWLSLASHEFFHTWNVRRLRPKSLVKYDYENEVYTDSLWVCEGITSYYEELALVRAGLISRSEFLSKLSRNVESVQRTGGRKLQSLKDSSYDAWIKYYRPDENSSNTRISYYSKGAVVSFLLDAKIRKLTKGKKSLDDVMKMMFANFSKSGFTSEEFRETASTIAGEDLSDWFVSVVDSTDELDYSDIEAIGIIVPNKKTAAKPVTPPKTKSAPKKAETTEDDDTERNKKPKTNKEVKESDPENVDDNETPVKKKRPRKKKNQEDEKEVKESTKSEKSDPKESAEKKNKESNKVSSSDIFSGIRSRFSLGSNSPLRGSASSASRFSSGSSSFKRPWLGFSSSAKEGKVMVTSVKPDSPASDIGLNIDDEVIALEGFRVTSSVTSRLSQYKVGDELELLIARRGQLKTLTITIGELATESWRLRFVSRPSKEQKKQLDLWLNSQNKK